MDKWKREEKIFVFRLVHSHLRLPLHLSINFLFIKSLLINLNFCTSFNSHNNTKTIQTKDNYLYFKWLINSNLVWTGPRESTLYRWFCRPLGPQCQSFCKSYHGGSWIQRNGSYARIEWCSRQICFNSQEMAMKWEKWQRGDHYRLAFDRKNTWSKV